MRDARRSESEARPRGARGWLERRERARSRSQEVPDRESRASLSVVKKFRVPCHNAIRLTSALSSTSPHPHPAPTNPPPPRTRFSSCGNLIKRGKVPDLVPGVVQGGFRRRRRPGLRGAGGLAADGRGGGGCKLRYTASSGRARCRLQEAP